MTTTGSDDDDYGDDDYGDDDYGGPGGCDALGARLFLDVCAAPCSGWDWSCYADTKCTFEGECVPIDPDPAGVGEPCLRTPNGGDDCEVDSMCVVPPGETEGTCLALCAFFSPEGSSSCEPDEACVPSPEPDWYVCRPPCDPFEGPCEDGSACSYLSVLEGFACDLPGASPAELNESCSPHGLGGPCADGLLCAPGPACAELCDLHDDDPSTWCTEGTSCTSIEPGDPLPPPHENAGACSPR